VTLTAWRIIKRRHIKTAFNGSGARNYGGRWTSPGVTVVYTAETQSLAVLEVLVHLDSPELLQKYLLISVEIDESLVSDIERSQLPRNWRTDPAPGKVRSIGDRWILAGTSAVLRVPSALIPAENNFLLNPLHPGFRKLRIRKPVNFRFDPRLSK
jgi:RES domain-containing protein